MCFAFLDNVNLMRWTVLLWLTLTALWLFHTHVLKELSAAQLQNTTRKYHVQRARLSASAVPLTELSNLVMKNQNANIARLFEQIKYGKP